MTMTDFEDIRVEWKAKVDACVVTNLVNDSYVITPVAEHAITDLEPTSLAIDQF